MSKIALSGNASGTGTLTIAAPNTNSDATINLPTVTGGSFVVSNASGNVGIGTDSPSNPLTVQKANGGNFVALFQNTTAATPYCLWVKDAASSSAGYPLFQVTDSAGANIYFRVDSSNGNVLINNGYGSAAVAYGCRAWVNFNGTGTVAIRASGNVSSITDGGTGTFTINFTTSMPDTNYAAAGNAVNSSSYLTCITSGSNHQAASYAIRVTTDGGSLVDPNFCDYAFFR